MVARKEILEFHTECMFQKHMTAVLNIEKESFEHFWVERDFVRFLRKRDCLGRVVMIGDMVVGYVIYKLGRRKLHLLNFVVTSAYRRKGIGTQTIDALLEENFSSDKHVMVTVNVRSSNLDGQLFFKAIGFKAINVLRGFYKNEDAYRFFYCRDSFAYVESVGL